MEVGFFLAVKRLKAYAFTLIFLFLLALLAVQCQCRMKYLLKKLVFDWTKSGSCVSAVKRRFMCLNQTTRERKVLACQGDSKDNTEQRADYFYGFG